MLFLSPEDRPFHLIDANNDSYFCILDHSDKDDVDFIFPPVIFAEQCPAVGVRLQLGPYSIEVPLSWSIVIGDKNSGELEVMEIAAINDREFDAFLWNPLSSYAPEFQPVEIAEIMPEKVWITPKVGHKKFLIIPLREGARAPCLFLIRDGKKTLDLDISQIMG